MVKIEILNFFAKLKNWSLFWKYLFLDQKLYSDTVCTMYLPTFAGTSILVVNIVSGRGLSIMQTCV